MVINGKVGEGTAMNTLQLITNSGEVLNISSTDAKVNCPNGLVIGEAVSVDVALSAISITAI
ncbi:hypothetical protein [Clostridium sp.]|uniref:hypothetical protein n=1 Tax=Clostridium sp. TaxID=1506 RepID=UPI00359F3284